MPQIVESTRRGGALRILTILDEHTRECHVLHADRALTSEDVLEWLGNAVAEHGASEYLRSDNGPEFIARKVQGSLAEKKIRTLYIDPGSPWQNGFVESFHGRFRDECLTEVFPPVRRRTAISFLFQLVGSHDSPTW